MKYLKFILILIISLPILGLAIVGYQTVSCKFKFGIFATYTAEVAAKITNDRQECLEAILVKFY